MENTYRINENIKRVQDEIDELCVKYNRNRQDVQLMAVSKTNTMEKMQIVYDAGLKLFGENRVQELMSKEEFFKKNNDAVCHIIGTLQTNKVKYLPTLTDYIQSVDSVKLAKEISKQYQKADKVANILLEVNIGDEESKSGIDKSRALETLYEISEMKNIKVNGLMCIPPICEDEQIRKYFSQMHNLFVDISAKNIDNIYMNTLSMGMSGDYKWAIAEGSNIVRVGRGIFGERDYTKK